MCEQRLFWALLELKEDTLSIRIAHEGLGLGQDSHSQIIQEKKDKNYKMNGEMNLSFFIYFFY